jgi:hypothetical protein
MSAAPRERALPRKVRARIAVQVALEMLQDDLRYQRERAPDPTTSRANVVIQYEVIEKQLVEGLRLLGSASR